MPHDLDQGAFRGIGDLGGQFAPFFFEGDEFDLDEFVQGQFIAVAGMESLAYAAVPHFKDGIKMLRFALEGAPVGGCQLRLQVGNIADFGGELKNGKGSSSEPWFI